MAPPLILTTANDVLRGLSRYFARQGHRLLAEVALPNGRRADAVVLDPRGEIMIIEVKVARADLLGDAKWPEYLDWCDRFCWALSPDLDPALLDDAPHMPERCGLLVADRYDAALLRAPALAPLPPARRRSEHVRLGRIAMHRLMVAADADLLAHAGVGDIGA
jgi:hypothetical protein